jgi:hypothetical protein
MRAVQVRALAEGDGLDVAEAGKRLGKGLGVDGGVAVDGEVELEVLQARAVREQLRHGGVHRLRQNECADMCAPSRVRAQVREQRRQLRTARDGDVAQG